MCLPKAPKAPTIDTTTPAPVEVQKQLVAAAPDEDAAARKRAGRSSLKIDLAPNGTGGITGLNIPTG